MMKLDLAELKSKADLTGGYEANVKVNQASHAVIDVSHETPSLQYHDATYDDNPPQVAEAQRDEDKRKLLALCGTINKNERVNDVEFVGGLFPRGFVSMIAAEAGGCKTWLILKFAADVSNGGDALDGFARCSPTKALIFAREAGARMMALRAQKLDLSFRPDNFRIIDQNKAELAGFSLMLDENAGWDNFTMLIDEEKPAIVFIDSLMSFLKADEKKRAKMCARCLPSYDNSRINTKSRSFSFTIRGKGLQAKEPKTRYLTKTMLSAVPCSADSRRSW
ncbi:hypothetical protein FACS1894216_22200 [Synergistales bacterium]|nr:hypothetical protein FACS1894216_22200 [Synergistales bacterium]